MSRAVPVSILGALTHYDLNGDVERAASRGIRRWVSNRIRSRAPSTYMDVHDVVVSTFSSYHHGDPRHTCCAYIHVTIGSGTGTTIDTSWINNGGEDIGAWCDRMAEAWLVLDRDRLAKRAAGGGHV